MAQAKPFALCLTSGRPLLSLIKYFKGPGLHWNWMCLGKCLWIAQIHVCVLVIWWSCEHSKWSPNEGDFHSLVILGVSPRRPLGGFLRSQHGGVPRPSFCPGGSCAWIPPQVWYRWHNRTQCGWACVMIGEFQWCYLFFRILEEIALKDISRIGPVFFILILLI